MNMKRILMTAAAIVLGTAAFTPAQAHAQAGFNVVIGNAPPPARYEVVPVARRGHVWSPGHWSWNGRKHVWVQAHWERARAGHYYQRPQWRQGNNGWHLNRGGWQRRAYSDSHHRAVVVHPANHHRAAVHNRRDRDRDGVPNRYDSRPYNPRRY
jgi:hypothetical protein